jgi:rRNA maturation RNase YbeY
MNNPPIQFNFLEPISLADRTRLKRFLIALFKRERKPLAELQYVFCSDPYLLDINRQFLQHDYYTDIITFNLADKGQPTQGEIYISVDRVRDNAQNFDSSLKRELHRVIFHGALHLCGFKDKTPKEEREMRKMEEKYLLLYEKFQ